MADHIQKVMKVNFEAAWDEVGDEFEKEETFTLSTIKTLEGTMLETPSLTWLPFRAFSCTVAALCLPLPTKNPWPYLEHICCVVVVVAETRHWPCGSAGKCILFF